jgi:hypothetical protein
MSVSFSQGQSVIATSNIFFTGDTKRVRSFKIGQELWVVSNFLVHNQGVIKLARKGQNSACAVAFKISDVENSIKLKN